MIEYNIMNHHSRDVSKMELKIKELKRNVIINTDYSDYYKTRNKNRYKGINQNFFGIMKRETKAKWKVVFHDDIAIYEKLFTNIEHILKKAPNVFIINFYNPTNKRIKEAIKNKKHVIQHYNQFWGQCTAYNVEYLKDMTTWVDENTLIGEGAEDLKVEQYCAYSNLPMYTIVPSLAQHEGYKESTFGNPAEVVGIKRNSATYLPDFDATLVNWNAHFKTCLKDNTKVNGGLGLL